MCSSASPCHARVEHFCYLVFSFSVFTSDRGSARSLLTRTHTLFLLRRFSRAEFSLWFKFDRKVCRSHRVVIQENFRENCSRIADKNVKKIPKFSVNGEVISASGGNGSADSEPIDDDGDDGDRFKYNLFDQRVETRRSLSCETPKRTWKINWKQSDSDSSAAIVQVSIVGEEYLRNVFLSPVFRRPLMWQ